MFVDHLSSVCTSGVKYFMDRGVFSDIQNHHAMLAKPFHPLVTELYSSMFDSGQNRSTVPNRALSQKSTEWQTV